MVSFDRGFDSDYAVSLGAGNKYLPRLLLPGELARWHSLYDLSGPESCAGALCSAWDCSAGTVPLPPESWGIPCQWNWTGSNSAAAVC